MAPPQSESVTAGLGLSNASRMIDYKYEKKTKNQ